MREVQTEVITTDITAFRLRPHLEDGEQELLVAVAEQLGHRVLMIDTNPGSQVTVCQIENLNRGYITEAVLRQAFDPFDDGLLKYIPKG